ncbi:hypothetical protein EG329_007506 [Mollisiaceae sp. DMI_Dod_QoI]|nr:hypothetical protein EG329_007506 [Helotiales sp. DMI_Dod_QoI]
MQAQRGGVPKKRQTPRQQGSSSCEIALTVRLQLPNEGFAFRYPLAAVSHENPLATVLERGHGKTTQHHDDPTFRLPDSQAPRVPADRPKVPDSQTPSRPLSAGMFLPDRSSGGIERNRYEHGPCHGRIPHPSSLKPQASWKPSPGLGTVHHHHHHHHQHVQAASLRWRWADS